MKSKPTYTQAFFQGALLTASICNLIDQEDIVNVRWIAIIGFFISIIGPKIYNRLRRIKVNPENELPKN